MSRWTDEFRNHPLQATWNDVKLIALPLAVDDKTIPTDVAELGRLKRVIRYLDELLRAVDPDIVPRSIWAGFHPQASALLEEVRAFALNRNVVHIQRANDHADNLLAYVKPYVALPASVISALSKSSRAYVAEVDDYVATFAEKSAAIVIDLEKSQNQAATLLADLTEINSRVSGFSNALLESTDERASIKDEIDQTVKILTDQAAAVHALHDKLFEGESSTSATVAQLETSILEQKIAIEKLVQKTQDRMAELGDFHVKIFGEENPSTGEFEGGLKSELDERTAHLSEVETQLIEKHEALFKSIESLLPGATSAGLASAYRKLKEDFAAPVKLYTRVFYAAITFLVLVPIVLSVEHATILPSVAITLHKIGEWDSVLKSMLYKLPFVAPAIWLAVFASKRRSQYERLQQEYAHKEAFASSYESYKQQLVDLKVDTNDLQKALIAKAIDAVAYNASLTLDGNHDDKLPGQQILEKVNLDELKKVADIFKSVGR